MTHINRYISSNLVRHFKSNQHPLIAIVAGVVGCGKTTLIKDGILKVAYFSEELHCFQFSLDDTKLRSEILSDPHFFVEYAETHSRKPKDGTLFFIDEIQKSDGVFDAIKIAWDQGIKFILSGSNPQFLRNKAKKKLQRRAKIFELSPLSLLEILTHKELIEVEVEAHQQLFLSLFEKDFLDRVHHFIDSLKLPDLKELESIVSRFLSLGGLPALWASRVQNPMETVAAVVSRGFDPINIEASEDALTLISSYLSTINSEEFKIDSLKKKTGLKDRQEIYGLIQVLIDCGYLISREPLLFESDKRSYLKKFSYTDPGFVSYLSGDIEADEMQQGSRIEGYIQSKLKNTFSNDAMASLCDIQHYFKPYNLTTDNKVNYLAGEIDLLILPRPNVYKKIIPIEIKRGIHKSSFQLNRVYEALEDKRFADFGIVIYGGQPHVVERDGKSLIYWPYWLM